MFEEMWEWGEEHRQANFDEIAGKLAVLRRELMGEMLGELLLQHGDGRYEEVACPECGQETTLQSNASPLSRLWAIGPTTSAARAT